MIDPRICKNPVGMIRMKNKDGTWLFSEAECLRRIEVILCRAKKIWLEELVLERDIAFNRQKIINEYNDSGLNPKQFIEHYNQGLVLPEVRERLGRWGLLNSTSVFYLDFAPFGRHH